MSETINERNWRLLAERFEKENRIVYYNGTTYFTFEELEMKLLTGELRIKNNLGLHLYGNEALLFLLSSPTNRIRNEVSDLIQDLEMKIEDENREVDRVWNEMIVGNETGFGNGDGFKHGNGNGLRFQNENGFGNGVCFRNELRFGNELIFKNENGNELGNENENGNGFENENRNENEPENEQSFHKKLVSLITNIKKKIQ